MMNAVKPNQAKRQIEELKEVVKAAGSQLVYLPKIVLAVEVKLKSAARAAKPSRSAALKRSSVV